jgi:hypothetical protein
MGMSDLSPTVGPNAMFDITQKHVLGGLGYVVIPVKP